MNDISIVEINSSNIFEKGMCCSRNKKSGGYNAKVEWTGLKCNNSLKLYLAKDDKGVCIGYIEYTDSEYAWRPVNAKNYLFIHCIVVLSKDSRNQAVGTELIKACEEDAKRRKKSGVCVMTSDGRWMAESKIFEKNGYLKADELGRFELFVKKLSVKSPTPKFYDWNIQLKKYKGWNIIYANQCPWHDKSVKDLTEEAKENKIKLNIIELKEAKDAQAAPSGFGVFSIVKDGELIEDHYISKTRFKNILKEMNC